MEEPGGCHAAVIGSSPVLSCRLRRRCFRQHSRSAKLRRDHVYDAVQFAVSVLPDHLLGPRHRTDRSGDVDRQCKHQHDVPSELFDTTDFLSVGLFARAASGSYRGAFAGADNGGSGTVTLPCAEAACCQLNSAIDSSIESIAFSVADWPIAMESAAR